MPSRRLTGGLGYRRLPCGDLDRRLLAGSPIRMSAAGSPIRMAAGGVWGCVVDGAQRALLKPKSDTTGETGSLLLPLPSTLPAFLFRFFFYWPLQFD